MNDFRFGIPLVLCLGLGLAHLLYGWHARTKEDAVAAFGLSQACRKPYVTDEACKRYPAACAIPLGGCEERRDAAEREWALKYPRQAAQRQANILEEKRGQDERQMQTRPPTP